MADEKLRGNDDYFTFPPEPDDDEATLSFDRLKEAFAGLSDNEAESISELVNLGFDELESVNTDETSQNVDSESDILKYFRNPDTDISPTNDFFDKNHHTEALQVLEDDADDLEQDGEAYQPVLPSEDHCELSPRTIFEAMLFVGEALNKPLTLEHASDMMRNVSPDELLDVVHQLNATYASQGAPYHIVNVQNGYRMVLRPEFETIRSRFYGRARETRLSQAAIDVLAIVAYQQPISAEEVQKIRNNIPSQSVLSQLVRRKLLEAQRVVSNKRMVTMYHTTSRFLQLFQMNSLDELPIVEEIDYK